MTISKRVTLAAHPDRVYAALTAPEEIVRYFPYERVESEGGVGGAITFHGELGGQPFTDYGRITAAEPGREFAYAYWSTNHGTPRTPEHHLTIRYVLEPVGDDGTALRVEHGNVPAGPYAELMTDAWDGLLDLLGAYLRDGRGEPRPA
jgi:uncharacterized protein YndB with AHSA1/START domain